MKSETIPGSTSRASRAASSRTNPRYSPRSVGNTESASTSIPCDFAKPSAAFVGLPAASNATAFGGPRTVSLRASCLSDRPRTMKVSRRGVPWMSILRKERRALARESSSSLLPCHSAGPMNPAGISSQPISSR